MDSDETRLYMSAPVTVTNEEIQRSVERREQLRREELEHLTKLQKRVQLGIDQGDVEVLAGTEMLLNISRARMALSGVGGYPAF